MGDLKDEFRAIVVAELADGINGIPVKLRHYDTHQDAVAVGYEGDGVYGAVTASGREIRWNEENLREFALHRIGVAIGPDAGTLMTGKFSGQFLVNHNFIRLILYYLGSSVNGRQIPSILIDQGGDEIVIRFEGPELAGEVRKSKEEIQRNSGDMDKFAFDAWWDAAGKALAGAGDG